MSSNVFMRHKAITSQTKHLESLMTGLLGCIRLWNANKKKSKSTNGYLLIAAYFRNHP